MITHSAKYLGSDPKLAKDPVDDPFRKIVLMADICDSLYSQLVRTF